MKNDRQIGCTGALAGAEQAGGHLAELLDAVGAEGDEAGAPGRRLHPLHACRPTPPSSQPRPSPPAATEPQSAECDVDVKHAAAELLRSAHR